MVKRPKLSQALENYNKKQKEKLKEKKRNEAIDVMNKNKIKKNSISDQKSGQKGAKSAKNDKIVVNDHVPCHIWTDGNKMQQRTRLPFHPNNNSIIILIGEGDFSYCRALVSIFMNSEAKSDDQNLEKKWRIVATALDSRETVLRKYRKSRENLDFLDEIENVEIVFGVDGTKLHEDRELKRLFGPSSKAPTRIIFNFPHTGAGIKDRERNIVAQQKMLQLFYDSVTKFMSSRKANASASPCTYTTTMMKKDYFLKDEVVKNKKSNSKNIKNKGKNNNLSDEEESDNDLIITDTELLAFNAKIIKEQDESSYFDENDSGESFEIHCTFKTGDPYDSWKPKTLAAASKLTCLQSFKFCPELYPGYQHCRTIGDNGPRDEIVEAEGWKEFLAGKAAKTFVFSFPSRNA